MDVSGFNLDFLNSPQLSGFLQSITTPSPEFLSKLSSISLTQMLTAMAALMFFRVFGGMFFAVISLIGVLLSTITSVVCNAFSVLVKIFGTMTTSMISLLGASVGVIISSPMTLVTNIIARWGRFLIPVVASGIMSSIYFHQDPVSSIISKFDRSAWVKIETPAKEKIFEEF